MNLPAKFSVFFNTLIGEWKISRKVSTGEQFEGTLLVSSLSQGALLFEEVGHLQIPNGGLISASRRWIWVFEQSHLQIFFDEKPKRLYHAFEPDFSDGAWRGEAHHDCAPDIYIGKYELLEDLIVIHQEIRGPKKEYEICSEYRRGYVTQSS
ncbi:MAG: DUF6314 family protein [Pseudomonadota bacterium]